MNGLSCDTCGKKLKVILEGGDYFVREGSTSECVNFEDATAATQIITLDEPMADGSIAPKKMDVATTLNVIVRCSENPDHMILATTRNCVLNSIYARLEVSIRKLRHKHA